MIAVDNTIPSTDMQNNHSNGISNGVIDKEHDIHIYTYTAPTHHNHDDHELQQLKQFLTQHIHSHSQHTIPSLYHIVSTIQPLSLILHILLISFTITSTLLISSSSSLSTSHILSTLLISLLF